jgi:hypothetical protein
MLAALLVPIAALGQMQPISPSTGGYWDPAFPLQSVKGACPADAAAPCTSAECWQCRALTLAHSLMLRRQVQPTAGGGAGEHGAGLFGRDAIPWIEANAIETLCGLAISLGGLQAPAMVTLRPHVELMLHRGFNSTDVGDCHTPACGSYDDQGWWALAWLKAFELTGQPKYLLRAQQIFTYLEINAWDETQCGGGCWWSSKRQYKNTVTNALFFTLAARLHTHEEALLGALGSAAHRPGADYYLRWAQKIWRWIDTGSQLRSPDASLGGLFSDGLCSPGWQGHSCRAAAAAAAAERAAAARCANNGNPAQPFEPQGVGALRARYLVIRAVVAVTEITLRFRPFAHDVCVSLSLSLSLSLIPPSPGRWAPSGPTTKECCSRGWRRWRPTRRMRRCLARQTRW